MWYLYGTSDGSSGFVAMAKAKLTARLVDSIKPPESGQADYWDTALPGFGLRASYGGRLAWVVMYRFHGRKRRLTLGTYPALSLADARDRAKLAACRT